MFLLGCVANGSERQQLGASRAFVRIDIPWLITYLRDLGVLALWEGKLYLWCPAKQKGRVNTIRVQHAIPIDVNTGYFLDVTSADRGSADGGHGAGGNARGRKKA